MKSMRDNNGKVNIPEISVLLPVFKPNREWLQYAIDSILMQSFDNFELILLYEPVEGDLFYESIKKYNDERIVVEELPQGYGLPKSLNRGLDIARGTYVARMDADDISVPERFQLQKQYMDRHPEIDILGGMAQVMGANRLIFSHFPTPELRNVKMMFGNAGIAHPTAFFRKEAFDQIGLKYNEDLQGSEDYYLWGEAVEKGLKIDSLNCIVLYYREHENQASQVLLEKMKGWNEEVKDKQRLRYYSFDLPELKIFRSFSDLDSRLDYSVKEYARVFRLLIEGNANKRVCDEKILKKEVCWQWFLTTLRYVKRGQYSLIFSSMFWAILKPQNFKYMISEMKREIRINREYKKSNN